MKRSDVPFLTSNEAFVLALCPYERPYNIDCDSAKQLAFDLRIDLKIVARQLRKMGLLERHPDREQRHLHRCTYRGTEVVRHYQRAGWLND